MRCVPSTDVSTRSTGTLCSTLAVPPLPVGAMRDDEHPEADFEAQKRFTPYTSMWNVTGSPAVSSASITARASAAYHVAT
mgnify:CR=1 FL=1